MLHEDKSIPSTYDQFQISSLKSADVELSAALLAESFVDMEPYLTFKMSVEELDKIFHEHVLKSLNRGLSFVIREKQTKKLAACCISFDEMDHELVEVKANDKEKYEILYSMMIEMSEQHEYEVEGEGDVCYIWDLAVSKEFRGRKLTRLIAQYALKSLKLKGYRMVFTEMINPLTEQTLVKSTGYFKEINRRKMKDYCVNHEHPWGHTNDEVIYAVCELDSLSIQHFLC